MRGYFRFEMERRSPGKGSRRCAESDHPLPRTTHQYRSPLYALAFHTNDLSERVHNIHEIRLRSHHRLDRLVGGRGLVDDVPILAAFHSRCHANMIVDGKSPLCFVPRHGPSRAMTAT